MNRDAIASRTLRRPALLSCLLLMLLAETTFAQRVTIPEIARGKGDACVEPTEVMRRNHMEFIVHQRDATVHRGIRSSRHSFKGCIDCHAVTRPDGQLARFEEEQHFCSSCHRYAAVKIDCFECHADLPASRPAAGNATGSKRFGGLADLFPLLDGPAQ